MQENPLQKFFRQPAIYMALPSKGKYWPDGTLDLPLNGEIGIMPMTLNDEISIRTPDALRNGQAVVSLIESCCPSIKNAWKTPAVDVDALLIGIRIASYGQGMDIDSKCPKCGAVMSHQLDLTYVLDNIRAPDYDETHKVGDLEIKLQPNSYFEDNKANIRKFEEDQIMAAISDSSLSDEAKLLKFNEHLKRLMDVNIETIVDGIAYIKTPDGTKVSEKDFIRSFISATDVNTIKQIRDIFTKVADIAKLPKPKVQCDECSNEYSVEVTFDYSRFFDDAS